MKTDRSSIQRWALVGLACLAVFGCAQQSPYQDPTPQQLRAFLDGQDLITAEINVPLVADGINRFSVTEIAALPKDLMASAVITFEYTYRGAVYQVEGVVAYQRSESNPFINPRFEANEVR
ncbi:MAG: hypothetical protein O3A51_01330 [Verrucomicrobia bacterium]|nr:hypothetical protein [Verrucomicrobiota bacterium]